MVWLLPPSFKGNLLTRIGWVAPGPDFSPDAKSRPLAKKRKLLSNPRYDPDNFCAANTAWKVSEDGIFSGPYFLVFSPNTGKYVREKLRIWILLTQWNRFPNAINSSQAFCTRTSLMAGGGCDFFFRKVRVAKRVRVKKLCICSKSLLLSMLSFYLYCLVMDFLWPRFIFIFFNTLKTMLSSIKIWNIKHNFVLS